MTARDDALTALNTNPDAAAVTDEHLQTAVARRLAPETEPTQPNP